MAQPKKQLQALRTKKKTEAIEKKWSTKLMRQRSSAEKRALETKVAIGVGQTAGAYATGRAVAELNRRDPGRKMLEDGTVKPGYGRMASYAIGVAGAIAAAAFDSPVAVGLGVAAGSAIAAQSAIDGFVGEGTRFSEGVTVVVTRPDPS